MVSLTKFLFVIDRELQKAVWEIGDKSDNLELGLLSEECEPINNIEKFKAGLTKWRAVQKA